MSVIVVGYVPKPEGEAALDAAIAEAKRRNARLVVVNSHRGGRDFDRAASDEVERELALMTERLDGSGVEHEVRQLVRGQDPGDDLADVAQAENADLIVIGLRKRTPVGKLLLGSNAQRILLDADCPVLAVKATTE